MLECQRRTAQTRMPNPTGQGRKGRSVMAKRPRPERQGRNVRAGMSRPICKGRRAKPMESRLVLVITFPSCPSFPSGPSAPPRNLPNKRLQCETRCDCRGNATCTLDMHIGNWQRLCCSIVNAVPILRLTDNYELCGRRAYSVASLLARQCRAKPGPTCLQENGIASGIICATRGTRTCSVGAKRLGTDVRGGPARDGMPFSFPRYAGPRVGTHATRNWELGRQSPRIVRHWQHNMGQSRRRKTDPACKTATNCTNKYQRKAHNRALLRWRNDSPQLAGWQCASTNTSWRRGDGSLKVPTHVHYSLGTTIHK